MPPNLTIEQVSSLAPDPTALRAAQGLANERQWTTLGRDDLALWGECKGSAKEPYKVRVDLSNNGTACSCPSRKFPCKHALALMLLAASRGKISAGVPPAWVSEWLEKRAARSEAAEKRSEKKPDPEARKKDAARRAQKREKLVQGGREALEQWLKDAVRMGLAAAQNAPASYWEEAAARMVDSQLPGAARMIREMGLLPKAGPDWAQKLLWRMGRLYLLTQAYQKLGRLPVESQEDVRGLLGWNVNQDELLQNGTAVTDDWLVLSSRTDEDEKTGLRTQVNWLWGKDSRRAAQILQFAYRNQPMDTSLAPGLVARGEMVFFPGAYPLRGIFKQMQLASPVLVPKGFPTLTAFLDECAAALGKNPWLEVFPVVLEEVVPLRMGEGWALGDRESRTLPLATEFTASWELYALSGERPITVFCLWNGFALNPQAAWDKERMVGL
ncbi:MAG: SWIM zinc finger family protein [Anaerolineaceae bacterium]|nr:SWIM zinc finger family protein [Anaerolineaceae bacterium]